MTGWNERIDIGIETVQSMINYCKRNNVKYLTVGELYNTIKILEASKE